MNDFGKTFFRYTGVLHKMEKNILFPLFVVVVMQGIERGPLHRLGKCSKAKLTPSPRVLTITAVSLTSCTFQGLGINHTLLLSSACDAFY